MNQIFELVLEQCVANYYGDNTIAKNFINLMRVISTIMNFYWSHLISLAEF